MEHRLRTKYLWFGSFLLPIGVLILIPFWEILQSYQSYPFAHSGLVILGVFVRFDRFGATVGAGIGGGIIVSGAALIAVGVMRGNRPKSISNHKP